MKFFDIPPRLVADPFRKGTAGAVDWRGGIDLIEGIDGIEKK